MRKLILLAVLGAFALSAAAQFSKPRREYVEWLVTADKQSRTYKTGEKATITIEAYKGGKPLDGVTLYYQTGDEMFLSGEKDSTVFRDGRVTIDMGIRTEPGFRACDLRFTVYGKTYKDLVKLAYEPENIRSFTAMPKDFDSFWKKTLKAAGKVDINAETTPLPQYSTDKVEVSLVKLTVGPDGRNMYGYLTRPKDGKKHPVLFCPPGAGAAKISPTTFYSERGFIYLNVNIHSGCNPELDDEAYAKARKVADNYNRRGIGDKQTFYYRSVYAGCSRCIDFLCTLSDWDGRNVGVTGGSQGGALTIVTAALNPKVTFCSPFYPALCDLLGFKNGRAGGWPKYFQTGDEQEGTAETLPYYDVVNFARLLKCPVFYSFGYNDDTCSPSSTFAAYNAITAPKTLSITPSSGHWRFPETNDESVEWMKKQCSEK
jgi:cephalosporin-C deacetylase